MTGHIPDSARRWVTADDDGHLTPFVMQWLVARADITDLEPLVVEFSNSRVWIKDLGPGWTRPPRVALIREDGVAFEADVEVALRQVVATISEPLTGKMILY